ncbi:MAG: hypothetical protein NVV82_01880 [Sporocytophaga sp.]|nr:hypothetical protein [Sporocytophaga sp.]
MKDSLTLAAVALTFYAFYKIFLAPKSQKIYIVFLIIGLFVLKSIKIYIILCLIPALLVYLFIEYNRKIKSRFLQLVLKPLLLMISIGFAYFAVNELTKNNSLYNIEKIAQTARRTSDWINYVSELQGGSSYTLGDYDATFSGIMAKAPAAVWVTLFRPYLWESKNIIMLFSAAESTFFLLLTIRAFLKLGISGVIKAIRKNSYIQFSLFFCIPFAFGIGISTYNFGSLVRYKIPMMSFYISSIYILINQTQKDVKPKTKISQKSTLSNIELHS